MTETKIQKMKEQVIEDLISFLGEECDYVFMLENLAKGEAELLSVLRNASDLPFSEAARAIGIYNDLIQLIRPLAIIEGQINE